MANRQALQRLSRFRNDQRGAIAIMAGMLALPAIALLGGGVDYSLAISDKTELQGVADAAALAAGALAMTEVDKAEVEQAAADMIAAHCDNRGCGGDVTSEILVDEEVIVRLRMDRPTTFLGLVGMNSMDIDVETRVRISTAEIYVYFALDMSGSMNIPFGESEMKDFEKHFKPWGSSCSFACHRMSDSQSNRYIGGEIARDKGILLREDEIKRRTGQLIEALGNHHDEEVYAGIASWGHSDPWKFEVSFEMDDDLNAASTAAEALYSLSGGTWLTGAFNGLEAWIERDKKTLNPKGKRLAVVMTDGVDSGPVPIDPRLCDSVKATGTELFVVNVVYPDLNKLKGGNDSKKKMKEWMDDLPDLLMECASSPGHYFEATDGTDFHAAFDALEERIGEVVRYYMSS